MKYAEPLIEVVFLRRYKRFLADVRLADGSELTVHCANSGSMKHCQPAGGRAWISDSHNPKRKLRHTLEVLELEPGVLACVNTHRPNALAEEAINAGVIGPLAGYGALRREVKYGSQNSRIDVLLDDHPDDPRRCYVEVKNVTLGMGAGLAQFPDAVTKRGTKHLQELMEMVAEGHRAVLLFCSGRTDTTVIEPADAIDPVYGRTLREAAAAGVEILAWGLAIEPAVGLKMVAAVPVRLPPLPQLELKAT